MTSHSHVDQKTTVQELMNRVRGFRDSRDWRKHDTPRNLASSICIEAAELLEHFQWKTDEQTAEMMRITEKLAGISDELTDVCIYCLGFSEIVGIDGSNAVQTKLHESTVEHTA